VNAVNGIKTNGMDGLKGTNRVFPHLDDLSAAKPNVDMNWPMRRLLQEGELLAKQADTHLDFRRPDVALQEYIKASTVAVVLVPRHKDYPSLHTDRGELHRLYQGLTKRINAQHEKFAEVKQVIKENNARSGVKPTMQTGSGGTNGVQNGHARAQSTQNPIPNGSATNGTPPKKKPPVQPKPEALHGNAIHHTSGNSIPHTDLATRFANLRTPEPKQDPRIRTQPISIPGLAGSTTSPTQSNYTTMNRPTGPRDLPSVPRTMPQSNPLPLGINIPSMPKPPAAVYDSPIRGPETASANLLSSRSSSYRNSGREESAPPISTVGPTPTTVDNRTDYFAFAQPAHTSGDNTYLRKQQKSPPPVLSDSPTVTAEELVDLLRKSSQSFRILLVDLRSREEFDTGHIMSQFIICVEPITLRRGISGDELAESMVIAPDLEQNLYDQRHEFDLIVFYDQSSELLKPSNSGANDTEKTLNDFVDAVFEYGYEKRTKRRPKLLSGGIDAWVDLLGPNSLKHSVDGATLESGSRNGLKPGRPLSRTSMARARNLPIKRRRTYSSRPLTKEEENKWDSALKEESIRSPVTPDDSLADDLVYARTTEDFFRRYPELPAIQESMVQPISTPPPQIHHDEFASVVPRPPARPPPALPRQRSSGISERGPIATYAHSTGDTITQYRVTPGLTGLHNPNNLCYFNSAIQVLSATPFLRELLLNYQYPPAIPIPRKGGESSDPPQLMVRSLGNLLGHMWSGQYDYVTPNTLRVGQNTLAFTPLY
jgi:ubiquitin carboxyl-terminal hydrolase 8